MIVSPFPIPFISFSLSSSSSSFLFSSPYLLVMLLLLVQEGNVEYKRSLVHPNIERL